MRRTTELCFVFSTLAAAAASVALGRAAEETALPGAWVETRSVELEAAGIVALPPTSGKRVRVALDRARSVQETVSLRGGTVAAQAADGTVFTLVIPNGALLAAETITLTPVKSMRGLPFSPGLVAAVQLEPEGLRLLRFATLRIEPPEPVPLRQETTFAYRAARRPLKELYLYPPVVGRGLRLKILRFGGYGVAGASSAEQTAEERRIPKHVEDQLSHELQPLAARARRAGKAEAPWWAGLEKVLRDHYLEKVRPSLPILRTDCDSSQAIASVALGWARSVELLGFHDTFAEWIEEVEDAVLEGLVNCYDTAHRQCVEESDPAQIFRMLSALRAIELLGEADGGDRVDRSKIERCVRFELTLESAIEIGEPTGDCHLRNSDHLVRAKVPIRMKDWSLTLEGSAPLHYVSASGAGSCGECSLSITGRRGDVFTVLRLEIEFNLVGDRQISPPRIRLRHLPGDPLAQVQQACPGGTFYQDVPYWYASYAALHVEELSLRGAAAPAGPPDLLGLPRLPQWSYTIFLRYVGDPSSWAEKDYDQEVDLGELVLAETTLFRLRHTPQ